MTTQTTARPNAETMPNPQPWWGARNFRPAEYRCTGTYVSSHPHQICNGEILSHAETGARVEVKLYELADVEPGDAAAAAVLFVDMAAAGAPRQMLTAGMVLDLVANRVLRIIPR